MGIKNTLRSDLTTALKERDEPVVATIRMALTAISKEEVAGKEARELSDDEVIAVLATEVKRRKESAAAFTSGGRAALADRERLEADILTRYLPAQLGDAELEALVTAAVDRAAESGLSGGRAMGAVMKELKPLTAGRVDGGRLAELVRSALEMN